MSTAPVLTNRQLNRAFLGRQMLLERQRVSANEAIERLVGLQGQTPIAPYVALWSRLVGFDPADLSALIEGRDAVRIGLLRTTIHLVSTRDALALRPVLQDVLDRAWRSSPFQRQLAGVDLDAVLAESRRLLEGQPRSPSELSALLVERWPGRDRNSLAYASRFLLPLVQVPPRGLWRRTGLARHTTLEAWTGTAMADGTEADEAVLRYLAAFGPASVADMRIWSWMTGLRAVIDRLRPRLRTFRDERGRELFDVTDGLLPDADSPAPPRFLPDYDNLVLSHDDRSRVVPSGVDQTITWDWGALLLDGFVAGTWKVVRSGKTGTLRISTLAPVRAEDRGPLLEEGERLLTFMAADATTRDIALTER